MLTLQIKEKEIENLTPEEEFIRGTVGAKCQINFDEFWQGYEKYIVFKRVGYEPINIMVDSLENEIEIPYTILAEIGEFKIGVFGITETETLPTLYSKDIKILYGTDTHGTTPPTYTPSEIDQLRLLKQDKLVSGENIKTINNQSILGSGNITIEGGSGSSITIDQTFDPDSENAQSGKAVAEAVAPKLDNPNTEGEAGQILGLDTNLLLQWTNKENDFELIADITAEEDVTSFNIPLNGIVYSEFIFILCQPNLRPTESWVGLGLKNDTANLGFLNSCLLMNAGGIPKKTILWYGKILPDNILPNLASNGNNGGVFGFTGANENSLGYPINYFGDVSHKFATFFKDTKGEPVRLMKAEGTYFKFGANGMGELVDYPLLAGTRVILLGKRM